MSISTLARRSFLLFFAAVWSFSCAASDLGPRKLELPELSVQVSLSDEATKWLQKTGETIIVAAYFADEIGPDGLPLGNARIELRQPGIAQVRDVPFDQKIAALIPNPDYAVLINVVSGRRTDDRNLLKCDHLQGAISQFQRRITKVYCTLGDWAKSPQETRTRFTGEMSGKDFLAKCSSTALLAAPAKRNEKDVAFCIGFVRGAIHAHESFLNSEEYHGERLFCIPRERSELDYTVAVFRWIERIGSRSSDVGNLILGGLHQVFPCAPAPSSKYAR